MEININLSIQNNLFTVINDLAPILDLLPWEEVEININYLNSHFIDYNALVLIVAICNEYKESGWDNIRIYFNYNEVCDRVQYLSRMDFFKHLEIPFDEDFSRHRTDGRLLEITNIAKGENTYGLVEELIAVFESSFELGNEERDAIVFAINELICNITLHAKTNNGGYIYCQKYPRRGILDLIVVDSGQGISNSLKSKYPGLTNEEYLKKSIEFGSTDGQGNGHGLYFIHKMILNNSGKMILTSGNNSLHLDNGSQKTKNHPTWNGTVINCKFNLNKPISQDNLFNEYD